MTDNRIIKKIKRVVACFGWWPGLFCPSGMVPFNFFLFFFSSLQIYELRLLCHVIDSVTSVNVHDFCFFHALSFSLENSSLLLPPPPPHLHLFHLFSDDPLTLTG